MRLRIALRNLIISQALIISFLIFAYLIWFPHSFSQLGGFNKTALMLIIVDLVLGPMLVFIVFKEGKKYLKFDINTLLAIQITAFIFGAYSLFLKHPAYAVFNGDRFSLTNISHLHPQQHWFQQLRNSFFSSPKLVITKLPTDLEKQFQIILNIDLKGEPDIDARPELFEPINQHIETILKKRLPVDLLFTNDSNGKGKQLLNQFLKQHGGNVNDYAFFPLTGNNKRNVVWVLNRSTAEPVGIINYNPWIQVAQKSQRN